MYNRFFAFGCSFTCYKWPTWADYLYAGGIAEAYENWALPGGSNDFVFHSLIECSSLRGITAEDYVAIMWSQPWRIADYTNEQGWDMPGNAYLYQPKERVKYLHEDQIALENQTYFRASINMLQAIGCDFTFTSMERIDLQFEDVYATQDYFKPSMAEFLGYTGPNETDWRETLPGDRHPSPREHASFAKTLDTSLNHSLIDKLCDASESYIFESDSPHRQEIAVFPEKIPQDRLPNVESKVNSGSGSLIDVNRIQPFDWE
jgi:hypothetical protein